MSLFIIFKLKSSSYGVFLNKIIFTNVNNYNEIYNRIDYLYFLIMSSIINKINLDYLKFGLQPFKHNNIYI